MRTATAIVRLARADRLVDDAGMWFLPDRKALLSIFFLPLVALAACDGGGGGEGGTGGSAGSGATGGGGAGGEPGAGGGGAGGAPMKCEGPGYEGGEQSLMVGVVTASVIDQNGMPAKMTSAQVCGTDICLSETTSDAGTVTVNANQMLKAPAFKYGDGFAYAKVLVPLEAGDTTFTDIVTAKLPDVGTGDIFQAGASASSNGVIIDIAAGGMAEYDTLVYEDESTWGFRIAEIPLSGNVPWLDPAIGLDAVWGAAPLETVFCPPATVHVPNTPGYNGGSDVEIFILGLDALQHWAPYGKWHKVADAKVSDDGAEIVSVDGQGLPVLSTFGVRLAQ
jgi:hypothetical protein